MKCFADTYHDGLQLLSVPLWLDRKNQKQVLRPETAAGGRFSKPHWPFLWAASFRWAASNSIWSEETEVNTPTFTHTWTLKSPLWNHTYFLEFSQAICGQREDACIETHVSRLTYVHVKWFLTVPSSYILLLLCRTQGCRESWKSEQSRSVKLDLFTCLFCCCPHLIEKQQQRVKQAAALEVSSCGSGGFWTSLWGGFVTGSYTSSIITCFRRTGASGTIVPPYLRHTDVSLFSPSKRLFVSRHAGLTVAVIWTGHTHSHTRFLLWMGMFLFHDKHLKVVKGINLLQLCNPKRWTKRLQQCLQTNETSPVYIWTENSTFSRLANGSEVQK